MNQTGGHTLRNTVNTITNFVFPVSASDLAKQRLAKNKSAFEYVSYLPLQMVLYFNSFYFPFWIVGSALALSIDYVRLDELYRVGNIAVITLFGILEIVRLYIGYLGNLTEKVPELAGSWLLTLLIQLPIICFLLFNTEMILSPFERAIHVIMFTFVVVEIILGYIAIRILVNHQALKFHAKMEYDGIETMHDNHEVRFRSPAVNNVNDRYVA